MASTYVEETEKIITGSILRYEEKLDSMLEPVYLEEKNTSNSLQL